MPGPSFPSKDVEVPPAWRSPLLVAAVVQIVLLVFAMLVLDGGALLKVWAGASGVYWILIGALVHRHPAGPTPADRWMTYAGLPILAAASLPVLALL